MAIMEHEVEAVPDSSSVSAVSSVSSVSSVGAIRDAETRGQVDPRVVCLTRPRSAAAEQYRLLALRIEAAARAGRRRIAITSATVGEGRTLTAANTALALGRGRRNRVTLVDCDLMSPGIHRVLGLDTLTGLGDILERRSLCAVDQSLWRFGDDELFVLPAGRCHEPHVAIGSPRMGEVLDELSRRSDVVLIDAPPVLPTADLPALVRHVDGVILAIRAGRTPREVINLALDQLAMAEAPLLGCVLVGIEAEAGTTFRLCADYDRRVLALPAPSPAT